MNAQLLDRFLIGKHQHHKQKPFAPHYHGQYPPTTIVQMANLIDIVEEGIRDDGILTIQQPSVWGQARMTLYRRDVEREMKKDLTAFSIVLSARTARSDQAAYENLTSLSAALNKATPATNINFDKSDLKNTSSLLASDKLLQFLNSAFKDLDTGKGGKLGVEPTVYLDQKKRYLDHLNQIRRINLGDDNTDSAGYGMYLVRMPASILPGEKTRQNHGAQIMMTAQHDFEPEFLPRTFRNLVINDLIDQLTPVVYDIVLHGGDVSFGKQLTSRVRTVPNLGEKVAKEMDETENLGEKLRVFEKWRKDLEAEELKKSQGAFFVPVGRNGKEPGKLQPSTTPLYNMWKDKLSKPGPALSRPGVPASERKSVNWAASIRSVSVGGQQYPVAPAQLVDIFGHANLAMIAALARSSQTYGQPHAAEVRGVLRRHLESAYDIMEKGDGSGTIPLGNVSGIQEIVTDFRKQEFSRSPFWIGHVRYDELKLNHLLKNTALGALCWAIAVEAAFLNEQLRDDIRRQSGINGFRCATPVEELFFHLPASFGSTAMGQTSELAFREYVKSRWPILVFAQDPVNDQQNIADAFSLQRELRFAVAYSFANGKVTFNKLQQYMRKISQESETIALNRTVTAFSHGNDTFGWRFAPRYQNPPPEKSNLHVLGNMILRGGPPRDYQLKNSRLEPGQRELTAIVLMPSFLNRIRFDTTGNWYKLSNPDDLRITTGRMLEQGRHVKLLTENWTVCDADRYRPEDVQRLRVRLHQLNKMLPMQTHCVPIPYENDLGGFELFGQGNTALVPKLIGFEGIDAIDSSKALDVFLYGKNFSVHETRIVAGGIALDPGDGSATSADPAKPAAATPPAGDAKVTTTDTKSAPTWTGKPMTEILSREVMRITIPSNAHVSTGPDGKTKFVEVYVATPNGISNKLQVRLKSTDQKPAPAPTPYALNDKSSQFTIEARWEKKAFDPKVGAIQFELVPVETKAADILLDWKELDLKAGTVTPPENVYLRFQFPALSGKTVALDFNSIDSNVGAKVLTSGKVGITLKASSFRDAVLTKMYSSLEDLTQAIQFDASIAIWHIEGKNVVLSSRFELNEKLKVTIKVLNKKSEAK